MTYLKKSLIRFRDDLLSKGIYDIFKWLIILAFGLIVSGFVPSIKLFLLKEITISIYILIISILLIAIITALFISNSFKVKLQNVIAANNIDELTGLKNHNALNEYLSAIIQEPVNRREILSIILIDIDNFKEFNTKNGYNKADLILKKLGELLNNDKRATDETFRFFNRGDEFLIVAKETNLNQAFEAAERKRKLIEKNLFSLDNKNFRLTVSCGVTLLKNDDTIESLTDRVSKALAEAKSIEGKNKSKTIS